MSITFRPIVIFTLLISELEVIQNLQMYIISVYLNPEQNRLMNTVTPSQCLKTRDRLAFYSSTTRYIEFWKMLLFHQQR